MANKIYKLGELIEICDERNTDLKFGIDDVRGMTIEKTIIPTKADMNGTDISNFLIVKPNEFIYNPRTHGKKIGLGFNNTDKSFLISWNNIAFRVKNSAKDIIIPTYLFMNFNRPEWDRKACRDSWGTSTEVFAWNSMCDMEITLPSLEIQQKFVSIYEALLENVQSFRQGLDDLKLVCDGHLDKLKKESKKIKIGEFIELSDERNTDGVYNIGDVRGISIQKKFIDTKADMAGVSLTPYILVKPDCFAYVTVTSRNGEKITLAHNTTDKTYIVSSSYVVFRIRQPEKLLSSYLFMYFNRPEFDRFARFNSWGSARETFEWADMCEVSIPIPSIEIQKSIAEIYNAYTERKQIAERLNEQIKQICPVLIKGSLGEQNV